MACNEDCNRCGQVKAGCRCAGIKNSVNRAYTGICDVCDPCASCESMVKICTMVVPSLDEGRYYRNSFVFVQDEGATYYISDKGDELPFGAKPNFINDFDPEAKPRYNEVIYDLNNKSIYYFGPNGDYAVGSMSGGGGAGIPEAPTDGKTYARRNSAWVEIVVPTVITDGITTAGNGSAEDPIRVIAINGGTL